MTRRTAIVAFALCGLAAGAPTSAAADALPLARSVRIGRPQRAVAVRVEATDAGARIVVGRANALLPIGRATGATIERVALAQGAAVAVVRAQGPNGEGAAVLAAGRQGAGEVLWSGSLALRGDPGERRAGLIETGDRTGDGAPDVVVGTRAESATICGQPSTMLFPRAVDPSTMTLRPVVLRRTPASTGAGDRTVTASRTTPGPTGPPLLRALRFVAASSSTAASEDAQAVPVPRVLEDPERHSFWAEAWGGEGRGEFVTARWEAPRWPIRALAITPSPADASVAARLGRPRALWLVGDRGARIRVQMPEDSIRHPGERYWIALQEPLAWRCMSLVLEEAYAPAGTDAAATHTGLAAVEAYTDLDFGVGLDRVVLDLSGGSEAADAATSVLARIGERAIAPVLAAWEHLAPLARRRAIRVLAASARTSAQAVEAIARAAADEDEEVRVAAVEALESAGARDQLATLARRSDETGDGAASALARSPDARAMRALLAALSSERGSERPKLRLAIRLAATRGGAQAHLVIEEFSRADPPVAAAAGLALALAGERANTRAMADLVRAVRARASRFEDRWRLVQAAKELPADPEVDRWLAGIARSSPEWMLRAAALEALADRRAPEAHAAARTALRDRYPRVRAAAVRVLSSSPRDMESVARLATSDSWPLVRASAIEALATSSRALPVLRAAVGDHSSHVRTAAVGALRARRDPASWSVIEPRLRDDDEWPSVIEQGVGFARDLCLRQAGDALTVVLRRGLRPDAWAPDVDLALEAFEALVAIGGPAGADAMRVASRPTAPGPLRAAARRARQSPPRCAAPRH